MKWITNYSQFLLNIFSWESFFISSSLNQTFLQIITSLSFAVFEIAVHLHILQGNYRLQLIALQQHQKPMSSPTHSPMMSEFLVLALRFTECLKTMVSWVAVFSWCYFFKNCVGLMPEFSFAILLTFACYSLSDLILGTLLTSNTDFPGFDVVMQYTEGLEQPRRKLDTPSDEAIPDLNSTKCTKCNKIFSNIWVLKAHYEEVGKFCGSLNQ